MPENNLENNGNSTKGIDNTEEKDKQLFLATLFLSGRPVDMDTLLKVYDNPFNLENKLLRYADDFNKMNLGVRIRTVSGGFQLVCDPTLTPDLEDHFGERSESLSRSALETVSIIAYKQPITKAEVETVRGVDCSGSLRTLLDRNLISVSGRRQVPGRPLIYITTKFFLEYFAMNDLSELPSFREWQELQKGV